MVMTSPLIVLPPMLLLPQSSLAQQMEGGEAVELQ
jgi:hypothetical protein